jgi:hypothetical protein
VETAAVDAMAAHVPPGWQWRWGLDVEAMVAGASESLWAPFLRQPDGRVQALWAGLRRLGGEAPAENWAHRLQGRGVRQMVAAGWADGRWLVVLPVDAVRAPPADGGTASLAGSLQLARMGPWVLLGDPVLVAAARDAQAVAPWLQGSAPPEDPVFWRWEVARWAEGSAMGAPPAPLAGDTGRTVWRIHASGAMVVEAETSHPDAVLQRLGQAQAWTSTAMGTMQRRTEPAWRPVWSWALRIVTALWWPMEIATTATGLEARWPAPACGGWMRNLGSLLLIQGLSEAAKGSTPAVEVRWQRPSLRVDAGCGTGAWAPPSLRTELAAAMLDVPGGEPAVLALGDLAGVLRLVLPTAGGLLPVALEGEELHGALGGQPWGMRGLDDRRATWAAGWRQTGNAFFVVGHPGVETVAPPDLRIGGQPMVPLSRGGRVWGTRGLDVELRLQERAGTAWSAAAEALGGEGVWGVVLVRPSLLAPWLQSAGEHPLAVALARAPLVALRATAEGPELWWQGEGTADVAGLASVLTWMASGPVAGMDGALQARIAGALEGLEIAPRAGGWVAARWPTGGWSHALGLGLQMGGGVLGGATPWPEIPLDRLPMDPIRLSELMQRVRAAEGRGPAAAP